MSSILIVKFLDISFKLSLMNKLQNGKELNEILPIDMAISNIFRYVNVVIYPLSFVFAVGLFRF
uniref:hypothetical protein n=1 Tax=Aliarcobacter sp. TaxID=2321116 RepID=UPI004047DA8B